MPPTTHLLALCGYAGAGKDTAADILVAHAGFMKLAFADALKAELVVAFGVQPDAFIQPELKIRPMPELALERCSDVAYINAALRKAFETAEAQGGKAVTSHEITRPRTPRESMQLWGTEYRRGQDPQYWTRQLVARVDYLQRELRPRGLVVADCRFANEWDALRARGAHLWQVKRPDVDAGGTHTSTTDGTQFEPEAVLNNAHDIRHLQQLVLGEYWALDAGLEGLQVQLP